MILVKNTIQLNTKMGNNIKLRGGKAMKFCWSTFMVKNMEESLKFYQEIVGFKIDKRFNAGPGVEIAFLGEGETQLELICNENLKEINVSQDIYNGFQVESLDEMMAFVQQKGIAIHSGPFKPNPYIQYFYVEDPNGYKVQFVEKM
jgi:lactoylglutathione lyase